MNVIVDYGNSSAKVGIFKEHKLIEKLVFQNPEVLKDFLQNYSAQNIIISSVNTDASMIAGWASRVQQAFILSPALPLPITIRYATPSTLGVDRIAAACGAWNLFERENCLAIDAGTCITYDFVTKSGEYLGGGISPGMHMRLKAMHTLTARLPMVEPAHQPDLVGDSTAHCMQSGVFYGIVTEMDGIISRYKEKFGDLRVILCGGDAAFFENNLKASIFASPELVLSGLNSILLYNVNQ